jgi:hypothetical protein
MYEHTLFISKTDSVLNVVLDPDFVNDTSLVSITMISLLDVYISVLRK